MAKSQGQTRDAAGALASLNVMYGEAIAELDLLLMDCAAQLDAVNQQTKATEQRMAVAGAETATARAALAEAQSGLDESKVTTESLSSEVLERKGLCADSDDS